MLEKVLGSRGGVCNEFGVKTQFYVGNRGGCSFFEASTRANGFRHRLRINIRVRRTFSESERAMVSGSLSLPEVDVKLIGRGG